MADTFSTTLVLEAKSTVSLPPSSPNLLRKRPVSPKEQRKSPLHLGIKVRRLSELEPYSNRTRGTLGGFLSLNDLGRADSDISILEKEKPKEKRCCLTALTKKIGLGIYVQARNATGLAKGQEVEAHPDPYGDERETWYMFYPPPPSPSLAFEPAKWDSDSSHEKDLKSPSPLSTESETEHDTDDHSRHSIDNVFASSQQDDRPEAVTNHSADDQDTNVSALIPSAEQLAEQYRDLLLPPNLTPVSTRIHSWAMTTGLHVSDPIPVPAPRTIRKVKAQQSLRNVLGMPEIFETSFALSSPGSAGSIISGTPQPTRTKKKTKRTTRPPVPPPRDSSLRHTAMPVTPHISPFNDFQFPFDVIEGLIPAPLLPLPPPIQPLKLRPHSPTAVWCVNNHAKGRASEETTRCGSMNPVGGEFDGGWL